MILLVALLIPIVLLVVLVVSVAHAASMADRIIEKFGDEVSSESD